MKRKAAGWPTGVRRSKRLLGLPALDTPLPPYRMTRTLPVTTATCKPLEDAVGLASVPACSVRRRRRWSTKAAMHWPVQNTRQEVEQDRIQCPEFTDAERSVSERPVFTPAMDTDAEDLITPTMDTAANNSEFSVQCSPTPRTPPTPSFQCSSILRTAPMTSPSSTTSEFSGLSMDSAYQDFCSRRDAFLAHCCSLV